MNGDRALDATVSEASRLIEHNELVRAGDTDDLGALMRSAAYRDITHPDHAWVSADVRALYAAQPGADAPLE